MGLKHLQQAVQNQDSNVVAAGHSCLQLVKITERTIHNNTSPPLQKEPAPNRTYSSTQAPLQEGLKPQHRQLVCMQGVIANINPSTPAPSLRPQLPALHPA